MKIIQTDTQYEIYRYQNAPNPNPTRARRDPKKRPNYPVKRTFTNTRRARKNFIRLVRANLTAKERPAFLTLTMRDIVSVSVAYSCLKGFITTLRVELGESFRYIAVPEFQKRGAVHFHILVWGFPEAIVKHERRTRILQNYWALGYVDIIETDGSAKLAGYLGKYMSKSLFSTDLGRNRAYTCSRNVLRPVSFTTDTGFAIPEEFWEGGDIVLTQREYDVPWLGACHYQLIVKKE